jgi:hypothetical protein
MKRLLSVTVFSFILAAGVSMPKVSAEPTNEALLVRVHAQAAGSNSNQPSNRTTQPGSGNNSSQQPQTTSTDRSQNKPVAERKRMEVVPGYCNIPSNLVEGSFEYNEALYTCKYGT